MTTSPAWPHTLLIVTFDEWGGFFDHVPPPAAPDVKPEYEQRGFRVPCLLISPFARRGHVAHGVYDHTSILKLVEWRWGLEPLSVRDAAAANLAAALDFSKRNLAGAADRRAAARRRRRLSDLLITTGGLVTTLIPHLTRTDSRAIRTSHYIEQQ